MLNRCAAPCCAISHANHFSSFITFIFMYINYRICSMHMNMFINEYVHHSLMNMHWTYRICSMHILIIVFLLIHILILIISFRILNLFFLFLLYAMHIHIHYDTRKCLKMNMMNDEEWLTCKLAQHGAARSLSILESAAQRTTARRSAIVSI